MGHDYQAGVGVEHLGDVFGGGESARAVLAEEKWYFGLFKDMVL